MSIPKPQRYHQLSRMAQALDMLLPLVQDVAEMQGGRGDGSDIGAFGVVPEMGHEDHALLDRLEKRKALVKRSISDMTSRSFGSIFRYVHVRDAFVLIRLFSCFCEKKSRRRARKSVQAKKTEKQACLGDRTAV